MSLGIRSLRDTSKVFERMKFGFRDDSRVAVEHVLFNAVVYDDLPLKVRMSSNERFSIVR